MLALRAFQQAGAKKVFLLAWNLQGSQFTPFKAFTTEEVVTRLPSMSKIFDAAGADTVDWTSVYWYSNPYANWPATIRKAHLNTWIALSKASLFVSLQDIFMFEPGPLHCLSAVWMPLHFVPVEHPTVLALSDFDMQLPISGWGAALLEPLQRSAATRRHIEVIGHGRCVKTYTPIWESSAQSIERTRFTWGWPQDAFVVLLVASNSEESGRKAFDAQLQAFSAFRRKCPRAWLHIHAEAVRAYDIPRLLETFGETDARALWINDGDPRWRTHSEAPLRGSRVSMTPAISLNSISEDAMADMYRASNVLLAATCSEGCGVPILEAQLCGCPVITTRATAMWEETLLGISVKPQQWIARMDFNSGWYLPHTHGITEALVTIEQWSSETLQKKYDFAKPVLYKRYSNEAILSEWVSLLERIVLPALQSNFEDELLTISPKRRDMLRVATLLRDATVEFREASESAGEEQEFLSRKCRVQDSVRYIQTL